MRIQWNLVPEPLLVSLAASGLCLVLMLCALGFVWLAMDTDGLDAPDVRPPAVQPGPPVVTAHAGQR